MMIEIYDTTLRDGTQRKDISLMSRDKLHIAQKLDQLGVAFIEGGWPGSNPKDVEFFEMARHITWQNATITAFGSTCQANVHPRDDRNLQALLAADTKVCTIFGKSSVLHVTDVLRTTLENNLRMIEESVAYLRSEGRRVIYDAEHFFDGYNEDPGYALSAIKAAVTGGAETVVLCDTNGGTMPWQVAEIVAAVKLLVNAPLGIHAHNDAECAVANSISAVKAGCVQVQGTLNGYGERCGNANLCSVIPNLELKMGLQCLPEGKLADLFDISHYVAEIANLAPDEQLAYVGKSAFAHKGGVHVAAMRRSPQSYQHIEPELVGNRMEVVVSELSGKANLFSLVEAYGVEAGQESHVNDVLQNVKQLESQGFSFEAAEGSVLMMFKRQESGYTKPFELIDYSALVEHREKRGLLAEATVKVRVNGEIIHTAAEGSGPVNALDLALRKALDGYFPRIRQFHLTDYKVRILDGNAGTNAITRVLIETENGNKSWNTVGAGTNIIDASWQALVDSIEYGLEVA